MSATVDILTRTEKNVIAVPIMAVTTRAVKKASGGMMEKKEAQSEGADDTESAEEVEEVAFVHEGGKLRKVKVVAGIQDNDYIQIVSGLKVGEEVVSAPYSAISKVLKDSMTVQVVDAAALYNKKE